MQKGQVKKKRNYKITICNILEYVWKFYNVMLDYLSKFSLIEIILFNTNIYFILNS